MNTPTPETDAIANKAWISADKQVEQVPADFARKLERERDEARHNYEVAHAHAKASVEAHDAACLERDQLRKVADELADSLLNCSPMEHYPSESWSRHSEKRGAALSAYNELPHVKKPLT